MKELRLEDLKGCWALVTGASSGFGLEFARHLAAAGLNLVLVARREGPLQELGETLRASHGIRVLTVPMDLSKPGVEKNLRKHLLDENVKIRLLVNNAAIGCWKRFEESSVDLYEDMVGVNVMAPIRLCLEFLPDLTTHPRSAIINLSSQAAVQSVPYMAVYAATKAFLHSFSLALYEEWRGLGVHVQTFLPSPARTNIEAPPIKAIPHAAAEAAQLSLSHIGLPLVSNASGLLGQRLFALFPVRFVLKTVAKMFRPPKDLTS